MAERAAAAMSPIRASNTALSESGWYSAATSLKMSSISLNTALISGPATCQIVAFLMREPSSISWFNADSV